MKFEIANLVLWIIAFIVTVMLSSAQVSYIGPVFTICMIGSTLILRNARNSNKQKAAE